MAFAIMIIVTFFMTPILVKGLGDDRYGIWVFVESIIKYLALFDLGITAAVVKYVAKFNASQDKVEINRVYSTSLAIFSFLGLLIILTTGIYLVWGGLPKSIDSSLAWEAKVMIGLLGLNLALGLPLSIYNSIISAIELYWQKNILLVGMLICRSLTFLWILSMGWGIIAIGIAITVFSLLQHLALMAMAHYRLPHLRFSVAAITSGTFRQVGNYSIWSFISAISSKVSFQTDAIVIGFCIDPGSVTYFAIAARLVEYSKSLVRSATMVLTPRFSVLDSLQDHDAIRQLLIRGVKTSLWITCFISQALIFLGPDFIGIWMGERYKQVSSPVLIILSLPLFLFLSQSVSARVLFGIGKVRPFACSAAFNAMLNLGLSLVLVRYWGIVGVAIGTAIPCCVQAGLVALIVCKATHLPIWKFFAHSFVLPLCGAAIATCIWQILLLYMPLNSYLTLFLAGIIGLTINAGIALAFDRELFRQVQSRFCKLIPTRS